VRGNGNRRRGIAGAIGILAAAAVLAAPGASALAAPGGAFTPSAGPPPAGSNPGAPSPAPSAGALAIVAAEAKPRKSFDFGIRYPRLIYTLASTQPANDVRIDVVNALGEIVRSFYREDVAPNVPYGIRWDGTDTLGKPARNGRYSFRIGPQLPAPAARKAAATTTLSLEFSRYGYTFPIPTAHEFGAAAGRFGAGRSGHTHQGQDVTSACGTPLLAARGGWVQYNRWDDGGGNYLVIDGKGTPNDFVYMHLAEASPLPEGSEVRTGQPIGLVGDTGDASGCHLHFEIWSAPGWYEGGSPFDPLSELTRWDRYS